MYNNSADGSSREVGKSTNPFDSFSDDDDSCVYQECNETEASEQAEEESLFSEVTTSTFLESALFDDVSQTRSIGTHKSDFSKKRVAPLDFDNAMINQVLERPALDFDSAQHSLHASDFISPLETAMTNQVEHLKSAVDNDDSGGEECNEDDEAKKLVPNPSTEKSVIDGGYLSRLRGISSYFGASETQDNSDNNTVNKDNLIMEGYHENEEASPRRALSNAEANSFQCTKFPGSPSEQLLPLLSIPGNINNANKEETPLAEVEDVLKRMNIVEEALKENTNKRTLKARHRKIEGLQDNRNVLKTIESRPKDSDLTMDHRHSASPWKRLIILEELGTASSWIILLLPYLAFFLAIILDANTSAWETTSSNMRTEALCSDLMGDQRGTFYAFPVSPLFRPCSYVYEFQEFKGEGNLLSKFRRDVNDLDAAFRHDMAKGVAFSSGPMTVPVLSTFLYGDVNYLSLSSESINLVSSGLVHFSTVVLQQKLVGDPKQDTEWFPVSRSNSTALAMRCSQNNSSSVYSSLRWSCSSSRNIDLLFSVPEISMLTSGNIRVETILSLADNEKLQKSLINSINLAQSTVNSTVNSKHLDDQGTLSKSNKDALDDLLMEIAQSASYEFTRSSDLRATVLISVRICCLLLTVIFICFWFWCMGVDGFFFFGNVSLRNCFRTSYVSEQESTLLRQKKEVLWWQCPWILFPERRYLLLLLLSLVLLQNPLLPYMYFHPSLYSSTKMRIIVDSLVGIGFHSILCLWLCLLEGLRYHTAKSARKRADHQKQILELRRATNFLASSGVSKYSSIESPSAHLNSYFDEFGDLHNAGPSAWTNLRLEHDMCGDGWADFLLPKLFVFFLGACAVIMSSLSRFSYFMMHGTSMVDGVLERFSIDASFLMKHHRVFVFSSVVQIAILGLWAVLIIRAALKTGKLLRKEPFLSTRPAQLAYRVLMSILVLGVTSLLLPIFTDEYSTASPGANFHRDIQPSSEYYFNEEMKSLHSMLMIIVQNAMQRFPYSGTAASLGPGEIIYCTVATLVVAFIFLPSTSFIRDEDNNPIVINADGVPEENQRRDKRDVLTMSKYTHTWRAFPMAIERHKHMKTSKVKSVKGYQLDNKFRHIHTNIGRGTIYERNYIPLYCVETALWLAECSWQTYYSASEYKTDDFAPGVMNLDSVGLELEADIYNEKSDIRAFVASNISGQVDGESDSIIVVAFRGSCSTKNLATDFNWGQESLPESFIAGSESKAEFQINVTNDFKDAESGNVGQATLVQNNDRHAHGLIHEADHLLRSAPVTRLAFPCVHSGFIEAYNLVRDAIIEKVIEVLERQIDKSIDRCYDDDNAIEERVPFVLPKIYVTGHSLGGALGQLLALDIACNVEILIGRQPEIPNPVHSRGKSDGAGLAVQKALSEDSEFWFNQRPSQSRGGPEESRLPVVGEEKPLLRRRHSFTSQKSVASSITVQRAQESVEFVHELLSGIKFAGERKRSKSLRPPIAVYTFGQARVGNHAFARFYKSHVPHTFRVVSERDAITSLPLPTSCPPALYKHAGLEVILDEGSTGNILVGPTVVETLFRFSKVRTNMFAHLMETYRDGLESALTHDELQEVYRTHGVNSRSIRSGYNTSDLLPDWVTHITRRNF